MTVLIKQEGLPKRWQLGKVLKLHVGRDNCVRSVDLKTSTGIVSRPIVMLYPLELDVENFQTNNKEISGINAQRRLRSKAVVARDLIKKQLRS